MKIKPEDYPIIAGTRAPIIQPFAEQHLDGSEFKDEYWAAYRALRACDKHRIVRNTILDHLAKHRKIIDQLTPLAGEAKIEPCWYMFHSYTIGVARCAPDLVFVCVAARNIIFAAGGVFTDADYKAGNNVRYDLGIHGANDFNTEESAAIIAMAVFMAVALPTFLEFAELETVTLSGKPNEAKRAKIGDEKYLNLMDVPVEIIDSRWFRKISRDEEFGVSGHFRLQPYGPGRTQRKLIYINDFIKKGYHREAKKHPDSDD
jgi:hypothetical protein